MYTLQEAVDCTLQVLQSGRSLLDKAQAYQTLKARLQHDGLCTNHNDPESILYHVETFCHREASVLGAVLAYDQILRLLKQ